MKRQPAALTAPWAITQEGMQLVLGVWSRSDLYPEVVAAARKKWEAGDLEADKKGAGGVLKLIDDGQGGKTAIVNIQGPLFRHASMFTELSNATSYDAIYKALEVGFSDDSISAVLLRVNSPGGEADGVGELADFIRHVASRKPTWAYVEGMGASAAYWLASQATKVVAYRAAEVGSIGVRITLVDEEKANEMAGLRQIEIVSTQSPDKRSTPVDNKVIARLQTRADDLAALFVDAVAKARGVTTKQVAEDFGAGDCLIASKAKAAGMIDDIGDFNSTLAQLAAANSHSTGQVLGIPRTTAMTKEPKAEASDKPPGVTACAKCGGNSMPPSYCKGCFDDQGDDEEPDGDEMRALGKATCEALKLESPKGAGGALRALVERAEKASALEAEVAAMRADGLRRDLRSVLSAGIDSSRLSLGAVQKSIGAFILRGDAKAAWTAAMGKIETTTRDSVIEAACSVSITADDLANIRAYVDAQGPSVASIANEPPRDAIGEASELDKDSALVARVAAEARERHSRLFGANK